MLAMLTYIYIGFMFRTNTIYVCVCERCICTERICHVYINVGGFCGFILCGYGTGVYLSIPYYTAYSSSNVIGIVAFMYLHIAHTQRIAYVLRASAIKCRTSVLYNVWCIRC